MNAHWRLGGPIAENLILHGTAGGAFLMAFGGDRPQDSYAYFISYHFCPGLTWYFMPANMFLTAYAGINQAKPQIEGAYEGDSSKMYTLWGVRAGAEFGKEWWVSDNLGMGVVLSAWYANGFGDGRQIHTLATSIGMSITHP